MLGTAATATEFLIGVVGQRKSYVASVSLSEIKTAHPAIVVSLLLVDHSLEPHYALIDKSNVEAFIAGQNPAGSN
jgi:hypothetical protein